MEDDKRKSKKNKKKKKYKNNSNDNSNSNSKDGEIETETSTSSVAGDNACASALTRHDWLQEEARLRDLLKKLLYENDSYAQTQLHMEHQITQLLQHNSNFTSQENFNKELISNLNNENARFKMQVLELERARDSLSHENKVLLDNISTLQSCVQDLEMSLTTTLSPTHVQKNVSEKNLDTEMEEAYALIGKLMTENADLVEKVNVLSMELGQQAAVADSTSVDILDYSTSDPVFRYADDSQEDVPLSTKSSNLSGTVPIRDVQMVTDEMDSDYASVIRHSSDTGEIVQISLDERKSQDLEVQSSVIAGDESVPLADAPLIGAPFRFISFVAKYVSGADLVEKDTSNTLS